MGVTTFSGPIRTGRDPGIPGQDTRGTVVLSQVGTVGAAVAARKSQIQLPPNCRLVDFTIYVLQAVSASAGGTAATLRIGTSADSTRYGSLPVSAVGIYRPTLVQVSVRAMASGAGSADFNLVVFDATVQASASGMTQFEAQILAKYTQIS